MQDVQTVNQKNASPVVAELRKVLADTYATYFKTHSYHWNVEGMHFQTLHTMFEGQYTEMWQVMDDIAERVRALGAYAPMNYDDMLKGATVVADKSIPDAEGMIKNLITAHHQVIKTLSAGLKVAEKAGDEVTADILLGRLNAHEKTLWMLNSLNK